jgi:hypothetical protein
MKLIGKTENSLTNKILSFFFRRTRFGVWNFSLNLIKWIPVSFKRKDFYLVPCRRKCLPRGLAQRRASMRLYESPKRWGARPRHLRPPARPFPRTSCFLRARNRARFFMRLHRAVRWWDTSRANITIAFVCCNRYRGPNDIFVHIERIDGCFARSLRSRVRSST